MEKLVGWDEVTLGAVLPSFSKRIDRTTSKINRDKRDYSEFNSFNKKVSDWRVLKPIHNLELCIHCQNCWVFCPDTAIISKDKKMIGIDYDHCKGCGICVEVCPTTPKSLLLFEEITPKEEALKKWPKKNS